MSTVFSAFSQCADFKTVCADVQDSNEETAVGMPHVDAGEKVAQMSTHCNWTLKGEQMRRMAFLPDRSDVLITTEFKGHCVKVQCISTGEVLCKFGEQGTEEGQFLNPYGVAVTADGFYIVVADEGNHRMQVLCLVVNNDTTSATIKFVRYIGGSTASLEARIRYPTDVAMLPKKGREETVLVTEHSKNRVVEYSLYGSPLGVFAGTGSAGSGEGEFDDPCAIAVLALSREVAIADRNNDRIQLFDNEGHFKMQFGSNGGQLHFPSGVSADTYGNLLVTDTSDQLKVFKRDGSILLSRNGLGMANGTAKIVAWHPQGWLAVANVLGTASVWRQGEPPHDGSGEFELALALGKGQLPNGPGGGVLAHSA
jgi:DNA-binding beta-propeller fold protein YncE